jgi:Domain of unknown function (DUF3846)
MSKVEMVLVPVTGPASVVMVERNSLTDHYRLVETNMVEAIGGQGWTAYLDEDGKLKRLRMNVMASAYAIALGWVPMVDDFLAGPVLFCGPADWKGKDTAVTKRVKRLIFETREP